MIRKVYSGKTFLIPQDQEERFDYLVGRISHLEDIDAASNEYVELWYALKKVFRTEFSQYLLVDKPKRMWYNRHLLTKEQASCQCQTLIGIVKGVMNRLRLSLGS